MLKELKKQLMIAMKEKDTDIKEVIRMVLSKSENKRIELGRELTDIEVVEVIKKEVKQIEETLASCDKRENLRLSCLRKIEFLSKYVPEQMTVEQVCEFVSNAIDDSCNSLGLAMKKILPLLKGKADNKVIAEEINKHFNKR